MKYSDQLQRTITLKQTPNRIISLVPSQTELLVDLGLESSIVGLTKFCVYPDDLRKNKTIVGGTKQVHVDKIRALKPDIILCNKEENTKDMILELEDIAPVHISDIYNFDDALVLIRMYGDLFSVGQKANFILQHLEEAYQNFRLYIQEKPKRKVGYFIWKNPWMAVGNNTFIDAMLELNNFENYFEYLERYPEINLGEITSDLDFIFLSSEPFPFKEKHISELKQIFPNTKVVLVDGAYFSWYGSRLLPALAYFKILHQTVLS